MAHRKLAVVAVTVFVCAFFCACTSRSLGAPSNPQQDTAAKAARPNREGLAESSLAADEAAPYLYAAGLAGILLQSWEGPNEIEPDRLLDFYMMQLLLDGHRFEEDENRKAHASPAQVLEMLGAYFDGLDVQTLQRSARYRKDDDEFLFYPGLGGVGTFQVHGMTESGDLLLIDYLCFSDAYLVGSGTLTAQWAGGHLRYIRCLYEEALSALLTYPGYWNRYMDGDRFYILTTGGDVRLKDESGRELVYPGDQLDAIVEFYLQTLDAQGAQGESRPLQGGWQWRGTCRRQTLHIDISPAEEGAGYVIVLAD